MEKESKQVSDEMKRTTFMRFKAMRDRQEKMRQFQKIRLLRLIGYPI